MTIRPFALVVGVLLISAPSVTAQLPFEHQPKKDPYRNLFTQQDRLKAAAAAALRAKQAELQRCVVYNTPVVPADPKVDPKIRVAPPRIVLDHKLRTVKPPVCK